MSKTFDSTQSTALNQSGTGIPPVTQDREEVCPIMPPSEQAAAGSGLLSELQLSLRTECASAPPSERAPQSGTGILPVTSKAVSIALTSWPPGTMSSRSAPSQPAPLPTRPAAHKPFAPSRLRVKHPLPTSPSHFPLSHFSNSDSHHPRARSHALSPTPQPHSRLDGYSSR